MRYGMGVAGVVVLAGLVGGYWLYVPSDPEIPPVEIVYYFIPSCPGCAETSALIDRIERDSAGHAIVHRRNLEDGAEVVLELMDRLDAAGIGETPSLVVFLGGRSLAGADRIQADLERLVREVGGGY